MDRSIDTQQPARSWHDLHQNLISSCAWQLSCLQRLAGGSTKKLHTLQIWFHSLFLIPPSCASEDRKKNEIFEWKITNNTFLGRPYPFESSQWWSGSELWIPQSGQCTTVYSGPPPKMPKSPVNSYQIMDHCSAIQCQGLKIICLIFFPRPFGINAHSDWFSHADVPLRTLHPWSSRSAARESLDLSRIYISQELQMLSTWYDCRDLRFLLVRNNNFFTTVHK